MSNLKSNSQVTTIDSAPEKVTATPAAVEVLKPQGGLSTEFSGKRALVQISAVDEDAGNHAVFIGVQGVGFLIPRGKQWNVPREVADVLRNACVTRYSRDDAGKQVRTEAHRFSFMAIDIDEKGAPEPVQP